MHILITKELEVFLSNTAGSDVELKAQELFGFGLGGFSESPLGEFHCFSV